MMLSSLGDARPLKTRDMGHDRPYDTVALFEKDRGKSGGAWKFQKQSQIWMMWYWYDTDIQFTMCFGGKGPYTMAITKR